MALRSGKPGRTVKDIGRARRGAGRSGIDHTAEEPGSQLAAAVWDPKYSAGSLSEPISRRHCAGSPWLMFVREPDQLRVEASHPQLAFRVRLVKLAKPNRHVA